MNYVVYYKDTLKVYRFVNSENVKLTNDLAIARCETIPQGDKFTVTNLQSKTEKYTVKEPKEVVKTDEQGNKHVEIEYIEVEKERDYRTCDLVAKVYTEEELSLKQRKRYEDLCKQLIAKKYPYDKEHKVQREYLEDLTNPKAKAQFDEYNAYVKECLAKAKAKLL